jgi:hypothetical protein
VPSSCSPDGKRVCRARADRTSTLYLPGELSKPVFGMAACPTTEWVGTDNVPSSAPAYTGFDGAYLEAEDVDGIDGGRHSSSAEQMARPNLNPKTKPNNKINPNLNHKTNPSPKTNPITPTRYPITPYPYPGAPSARDDDVDCKWLLRWDARLLGEVRRGRL